MLTRLEKRAVRCVAAARGVTESDLLRALRPEEVVAEFERLVALVRGDDPGEDVAENRADMREAVVHAAER